MPRTPPNVDNSSVAFGRSTRVHDRIGVVDDIHGSPYLVSRAIETLARKEITQIHFLGPFGFPSSDRVADMEYRALFDRVLMRHPGLEVLFTLLEPREVRRD